MTRSLGVSLNDVFETLQTYLGSSYINQFDKFNQNFQVRLQAEEDYRREIADVGNLYAANDKGQMVPLGSLLQCGACSGPNWLPATISIRRRRL